MSGISSSYTYHRSLPLYQKEGEISPQSSQSKEAPVIKLYTGEFAQHFVVEKIKWLKIYSPERIEAKTEKGRKVVIENGRDCRAFTTLTQFKLCMEQSSFVVTERDDGSYKLSSQVKGLGGGNTHSNNTQGNKKNEEATRQLFIALKGKKSSLEVVKWIKKGADIDEMLPYAIEQRHCVDTLLRAGANPNYLPKGERSAITYALKSRNVWFCNLMMSHGADFRQFDEDQGKVIDFLYGNRNRLGNLQDEISDRNKGGGLHNEISWFLTQGFGPGAELVSELEQKKFDTRTPIEVDLLKFGIAGTYDDARSRNIQESLDGFVKYHQWDKVSALIKEGAIPTADMIFVAIENDKMQIAEEMVRVCEEDVNKPNRGGATLLRVVMGRRSCPSLIMALLENKANPDVITPKWLCNLIRDEKAEANATALAFVKAGYSLSTPFESPFWNACHYKKWEIVAACLERGADPQSLGCYPSKMPPEIEKLMLEAFKRDERFLNGINFVNEDIVQGLSPSLLEKIKEAEKMEDLKGDISSAIEKSRIMVMLHFVIGKVGDSYYQDSFRKKFNSGFSAKLGSLLNDPAYFDPSKGVYNSAEIQKCLAKYIIEWKQVKLQSEKEKTKN